MGKANRNTNRDAAYIHIKCRPKCGSKLAEFSLPYQIEIHNDRNKLLVQLQF